MLMLLVPGRNGFELEAIESVFIDSRDIDGNIFFTIKRDIVGFARFESTQP